MVRSKRQENRDIRAEAAGMIGRRTLGGTILALWVGMVGWHVEREYFVPDAARLAEATRHLTPKTHHYVIREDGGTLGTASSRVDTLPDGLVLDERMTATIPLPGGPDRMTSHGRVEVDRSLRLRHFTFEVESQALTVRSEGEMVGDTLLRVRTEGDPARHDEIRLDEPPIFQSIIPIRLAMADDLAEGHHVRVPVLEPGAGEVRPTDVVVDEHRVVALPDSAVRDPETGRWHPTDPDSADVWRVTEHYGDLALERWVDEEGRVVRAETPLGFTMERRPMQLVRQAEEDRRAESKEPAS